MEIEILTTKRKLSKNMLHQMETPSLLQLKECLTIGYINVISPYLTTKVFLVQHAGTYYKVPNYDKLEKWNSKWRLTGKLQGRKLTAKYFGKEEDAREYLKLVTELRNSQMEHIFI